MTQLPSLTKQIAQLFIMGFRGSDISKDSTVLKMVEQYEPGGLILFDRDMVHHQPVHNIASPEQVEKLCRTLHDVSPSPLWIGIDQEGGLVNRLKPDYGFTPTLSHAALGELDDEHRTYQEASTIGRILKDLHISINFAPVVDIAKEADSSIIAKRERSFGANSDIVYRHAKAYLNGLHEHGILGCCKHFPGHGSAKGDTHAGFVDITDTWDRDELVPYQKLITDDLCHMIMTAHVVHKNYDRELPATLSPILLSKLLREELHYEGLVCTDDMQMRAISSHFGLKESIRLGLNAGIDLFCFGNNLLPEAIELSQLVRVVTELINEGEISEERIFHSYRKITEAKTHE